MRREILQIPAAVEAFLRTGAGAAEEAARAARERNPSFVATVARGSSDHVCTYLKYACELILGLPVASLGPSVASVYRAQLRLGGSVCLGVSQSGQSPDIVAMAEAALGSGALAVALTNDADSPLARACEHVVDIGAGPERSVAATKTVINSAVAGLSLIAAWRGDDALRDAIAALPAHLDRAVRIDWPELRQAARDAGSLYTLGRGPSYAIAGEAALKMKETCRRHAESYSSAEVLHGPVSIVGRGFPVLCFTAADAAEEGVLGVAEDLARTGARVFVTSAGAGRAALEHVRTGHPLTDPLALLASFYATVEAFSRDIGVDPDRPRNLRKVTQTR